MPWVRTLLLAAAVVLAVAAPASAATCAPAASWPAAQAAPAADVVSLVNAHRGELGLAPLAVSPTLSAAAAWKARHMAYYGYFGHDDPAPPVAQTVGERIAACGYAGSGIGENIAYGQRSAAEVMQGWLASPGHRANIERAEYRAIGVGVAAGASGALYWVQDFGTVADAGAVVPPAGAPPAPAPGAVTPAPGTAPAPGQVSAAPSPAIGGAAARQAGRLLLAVHAVGRRLTLRLAVPATVRVRVTRRARPACSRGRCSRSFTRSLAAGQHRLRLPRVRPGAGGRRVVVVTARAAGLTDVRRLRPAPGVRSR